MENLATCSAGQAVCIEHAGQLCNGRVVGLWERTNGTVISVEVDELTPLALRIGAIVRLVPQGATPGPALVASVWRRFVTATASGYRFLASDSELLGIDERRRVLRVRTLPGEKVIVEVLRPGAAAPLFGEMADIGTGGMRLAVPRAAAERIGDIDSIDVRFRLQDHSEMLAVEARIRHRRAANGVIYLGLQFMPADVATAERLANTIEAYVAERLR